MKILARKPVHIVILCYLGFITLYFINFHGTLSDDNGKWGTFGDFLGGALNPILGIITIVLTYDIIKNQIIESRQNEFKQMFELLFNVMQENKNQIKFRRFGKEYYGREALALINNTVINLYLFLNTINPAEEKKNFEKAFWSIFDDIDASSSTFMKTIHNAFKVTDEYCQDDKKFSYSDLIRSQFHNDELIFLMLNGLANDDFKNFKSRLEKFTVLKDLGHQELNASLRSRYLPIAFNEKMRDEVIPSKWVIFGYDINIQIRKIKNVT